MANTKGFNPETGEWNDSLTGDFLWGNANIGEALSIVMTPFTWSVICSAYDELNVLPGYHSAGNIGGRAYQNGTVMYSALQAIGRDPMELISEMGGDVELPEELTIPVIETPRSAILPILWNGMRLQAKILVGRRNLPNYLAETPIWCHTTRGRLGSVHTKEELIPLWGDIVKYSLRGFWRTVSTAWQYAETVAPLRRQLAALVGEEDANTLLSGVSSDGELLASLGPVVGLSKVARGEMDRQTYLERYGHRGTYEAEFSAPRPVEDPDWLDQQLAAFVESQVDVDEMLAQQRVEFDAAWDRLGSRHPSETKSLGRRLEKAAEVIRVREAVRSETTRVIWVGRDFALRAGELTGLGDDIFFLTSDEALGMLSGNDAPTAYIPARRDTYARYKSLPPYPTIISGQFDPFQWAADPNRRNDIYDSHGLGLPPASDTTQTNLITGVPGSAGRVEGLVRRLDRPEEGHQLQQGEILVASQTNIGWTLLFPRAAAVVTDVGAPLSHAAIVARELGIPAVVGCGDATVRLSTGDRVRVDGGRGVVEVLERARDFSAKLIS